MSRLAFLVVAAVGLGALAGCPADDTVSCSKNEDRPDAGIDAGPVSASMIVVTSKSLDELYVYDIDTGNLTTDDVRAFVTAGRGGGCASTRPRCQSGPLRAN